MLGMEISAIYIFCAKEYLKDMNFGVFLFIHNPIYGNLGSNGKEKGK